MEIFLGGVALVTAGLIGHFFPSFKKPLVTNSSEPRYWKDINEFNEWYSSKFNGFWKTDGDCDDQAEYLQRVALRDGYIINQQLVIDSKVYGVDISQIFFDKAHHVGLLALFQNGQYWYIESQNGNSKFIINRD